MKPRPAHGFRQLPVARIRERPIDEVPLRRAAVVTAVATPWARPCQVGPAADHGPLNWVGASMALPAGVVASPTLDEDGLTCA
ncbi:MAG: hypothetical protein ABSH29_02570 [Acidimicrobiales bacterium]